MTSHLDALALRDYVNIAFLIDCLQYGGTELNAVRTLESLARRRVPVTVMHFHADGPLLERLVATGHRVIHTPTAPLQSYRSAVAVAVIIRHLRGMRADVIHSQDIYSNIFAAAAGTLLRLPVLTSRRWKDDVPREGLTTINAWAHRRSTFVLPNSAALGGTLQREGVSPARIKVHRNFIDNGVLELVSDAERQTWRTRLGVPRDAFLIGCVARLVRVKRHDVLIDAFQRVHAAVPHAHLLLVGDGDLRAEIAARAEAAGVAHAVHFAGTLPHAPLPAQLFDVACLLSENEGFPNAVIEASACGVPVAATLVGGTAEVLIDQETGIGLEVADVPGTADVLIALAHDPARRRQLGDAGRAHVIRNFSETSAVDRLVDIYAAADATRKR